MAPSSGVSETAVWSGYGLITLILANPTIKGYEDKFTCGQTLMMHIVLSCCQLAESCGLFINIYSFL